MTDNVEHGQICEHKHVGVKYKISSNKSRCVKHSLQGLEKNTKRHTHHPVRLFFRKKLSVALKAWCLQWRKRLIWNVQKRGVKVGQLMYNNHPSKSIIIKDWTSHKTYVQMFQRSLESVAQRNMTLQEISRSAVKILFDPQKIWSRRTL